MMTTLRHTAKWELPSIYLVLVVLSVFCQAPLIWPVVTALTPKAQLYLEVPREITLDNFVTAFQRGQSITLLVNSLIYAGGPPYWQLPSALWEGTPFRVLTSR